MYSMFGPTNFFEPIPPKVINGFGLYISIIRPTLPVTLGFQLNIEGCSATIKCTYLASTSAVDVSGSVATSVTGTYGSVTIAADGTWTYTLNNSDPDTNALAQGATATDVFTYTMQDTNGATSTTTLTITITGTNDAPIAVADTNAGDAVVEAGVNGPGDPTATGNVLTNDTDVDTNHVLTVAAVDGLAANVGSAVTGTYGSVTINSNGSSTPTR